MKAVSLMICVNDPSNGVYCGRCAGIDISDFIRLEPAVLPEPRCSRGSGWFSIHRRKFQVRSHQSWVGNWCWDAITLDIDAAAELIEHCLRQQWTSKAGERFPIWHIDQADGDRCIEFMDRITRDSRDVPTAVEWAGALREMAKEVQS